MSDIEVGSIIVIDSYVGEDGKRQRKHSFVVISDEQGKISGLEYDVVASVMSSFGSEEHKKKKLKYKENFPINAEDVDVTNSNNREGYIKADQLHYFKLNEISYRVIGNINGDILELLFALIQELDIDDKVKINLKNIITAH